MSRASILFWRSAVSWCRASCRTLGARRKKESREKKGKQYFNISSSCPLPQLLKGFVNVLLQDLLHFFNQLHFPFQLLVYGVNDELVPSPSIPQGQAFTADL